MYKKTTSANRLVFLVKLVAHTRMISKESVLQALSHVEDPDLKKDLVTLGMIQDIQIEENTLRFTVVLTTPACPMKDMLENACRNAIFHFIDKNIDLHITMTANVSTQANPSVPGVKNIIAVASGKGGVGKSTLAVNLATGLARAGARVGLLDADIYGPSIPMMLGKVEPIQLRDDKYLPAQAHGILAMSIGYLTQNEPALMWRGPMLAKSLLQMIDITDWGDLDYLFIDLPPGTGDIQLSLVQKIPLTGAVIVTTPQNVATLDAKKALEMFAKMNIDVLGIIENMSTHVCEKCGHQEAIFSEGGAAELCQQWGTMLLGKLPLHQNIRRECDAGTPTAAINEDPLAQILIQAALYTSMEIGKKPLNYANKFPPIVVA